MAISYPKPTKPTPSYETINPRPLHPLHPPPTNPRIPKLPRHIEDFRRDESNVLPGFILSTHIFPAAAPRTKCGPEHIPNLSKERRKRMEEANAVAKGLLELRRDWLPAVYEYTEDEGPLWLSVNRFYRPGGWTVAPGRKALTLWLLHANGFHKETWEETLKSTISQEPAASLVEEIWIYDAVNTGDSALLNEGRLGNIFNWQDHARDLLQLLLYAMPDEPGQPLPLLIPTGSVERAKGRLSSGFQHRKILGIGHSLGGGTVTRVALHAPILFSNLYLVDPVIVATFLYRHRMTQDPLAPGAIARNNVWESREKAHASFQKNPFFAEWDHRVLQAYVAYALVEFEGGVKLKMSGYQEAVVFSERRVSIEVWEELPTLDPRIGLRWVMSGKENIIHGEDEYAPYHVWRRPENSSNIKIKESGHLIAQIAPEALGRDLVEYIADKYSSSTLRSKL